MENGSIKIDLVKLLKFLLKYIWLPVLLAGIGFGLMYWRTNRLPNSYTAYGTMYVYNGNPNLYNYQYANSSDLTSAVQLIDTYQVVVKSRKVMDVVTERLLADYPEITREFITGTLSMGSVSETGVVRVQSVTRNPQLSADICNAVLDVAPAEIIRVVSAGGVEIIDYAVPPSRPNSKNPMQKGLLGGMAGGLLGAAILVLSFLLNNRITDINDLINNYTPPILATIRRVKTKKDTAAILAAIKDGRKKPGKRNSAPAVSILERLKGKSKAPGHQKDPKAEKNTIPKRIKEKNDDREASGFLLDEKSSMEMLESYGRLRMNLHYTLVGKEHNAVVVTSAVPGEGKSTIAANLAITCALGEKRVLLVDSDLRRGFQSDIFGYSHHLKGLSELLTGECKLQEVVLKYTRANLDILPTGQLPPNPAELLDTREMKDLLAELEKEYDLVLLDMPPVNIVSDPLILSKNVAGCIFVTRQNYSNHKDIRKALMEAEMTDMDILGFVFYGENINQGNYYSRKHYQGYYKQYDHRKPVTADAEGNRDKKS